MGDYRIILHTDKDVIDALQKHSSHHFEGIMDDRGAHFFDLLCDCGQLVIAIYESEQKKTCTLTWREDGTVLADCSNCGEGQLYNNYNYCPNCGARNINPEDDHEPPVPEGKDFDGSVESLMQKANLSEEPEKCYFCGEDNSPGYTHCVGCGRVPPEEPEKEVEPPFKSITVRPITPPQWVRWGDVWVCSQCGHQMAAGYKGQLPEKCPRCSASMEEK